MTNRFSRLTALMACSLAVLFFTSLRSQAFVGETFIIDQLKYRVLTEEGSSGTVEVSGNDLLGLYHLNIPAAVENNGITYNVTSIGIFNMHNFPNKLSSITIPNSVTEIRDNAFVGCYLKSITIPDSVTSIGRYAFLNCYSLTNAIIGDGVTSIGHRAFHGCSSLTSVIIGKGVTSIGSNAFTQCDSLTDVYYRGDVNSVDRFLYATIYNKNKDKFKIYYPKGNPSWEAVVENGKWGNYNVIPYPVEDNLVYRVLTRKDTEVTLAVVDYIGTSADVVIPSSFDGGGLTCYVTEIADRAFHNSEKLQKVEIPSSIKYIGDEAFSGCMNLDSVYTS